jgi:hypothetical protein
MLFCFLNFVFVSNFSTRLSVVGLHCEWSWHLVPVRGLTAKYFSIGSTLEINKNSENSKYGAAKSPGVGQFSSSEIFRQHNFCMIPVVGSQYGAMRDAAESLIAELYSQGKLTMLRRKNHMKTKF